MKSFFKVKTVEEVLDYISRFPRLEPESVNLDQALGRVLYKDVKSEEEVPDFDRSTMDGFAVRARDTFGASESIPALFSLNGEIQMGRKPDMQIQPGQAARIWTGGMLPPGADAVVMIEYAREVDEETIELARPVAPYENIIRRGEDIKTGQVLCPAGRRLRPQDIGLLASMGVASVQVSHLPTVAIISTGDEVIPITHKPKPGQVRDVNSYSLGTMIQSNHGRPIYLGLVPDDPESLKKAVAEGMDKADLVILSGGSSVGVRDYTVEALESFPGSEILVHGVSVSPGKPTIMARAGNKSMWGLPGHTVSAMITAELFIKPLLDVLSGKKESGYQGGRKIIAKLGRGLPSVHGRQDYVRVKIKEELEGPVAHPILGKSGLISTMVKADGLVCIGINEEGRPKDSLVEVVLFE